MNTGINLAFVLTFSFASAACAPTGTPAVSALDAKEQPPQLPMCSVSAAPRVVASRVFVPAGVEVQSQDNRFAIRFAQSKSHCITLEAPSAAGPFTGSDKASSCPEPTHQMAATSGTETMLTGEAGDPQAPVILLGVVTYDVPLEPRIAHVVRSSRAIAWRVFQTPSLAHGQRNPRLVPLGDERFLLLWVDGNSETHRLRAQPVAGWGDPIGPAIDVSLPETDVIGSPSAAVADNGEGLITFLRSGERGFDVIAAPISCSQTASMQARASSSASQQMARR